MANAKCRLNTDRLALVSRSPPARRISLDHSLSYLRPHSWCGHMDWVSWGKKRDAVTLLMELEIGKRLSFYASSCFVWNS